MILTSSWLFIQWSSFPSFEGRTCVIQTWFQIMSYKKVATLYENLDYTLESNLGSNSSPSIYYLLNFIVESITCYNVVKHSSCLVQNKQLINNYYYFLAFRQFSVLCLYNINFKKYTHLWILVGPQELSFIILYRCLITD